MARKERGRVFCIHPGDAPRLRIASRDSHHECLTTLSLCRYGRFNFFAIMTGSLFPRGDKVAAKILCYAPMPSSYSFLSFSFLSFPLARFYARCACPRNVPLYTRLRVYLFFHARNPDIEFDESWHHFLFQNIFSYFIRLFVGY